MSVAYNEYIEATKDSELYKINHKDGLKFKNLIISFFIFLVIASLIGLAWTFFKKNYFLVPPSVSDENLIVTMSNDADVPSTTKILTKTVMPLSTQKETHSQKTKPSTESTKTLEEQFLDELKLLK